MTLPCQARLNPAAKLRSATRGPTESALVYGALYLDATAQRDSGLKWSFFVVYLAGTDNA